MGKQKKFQFVLLLTVFIISTCGFIYELIAGALASYLLGDSVKQFSYSIGVYMFAMGIGSYLSKYIVRDLFRRFVEMEILIGIIGGISSTVLFYLFHEGIYFQFTLFTFLGLTGMLVGMEIPLLMRILKDRLEFKDLVANIFTFDYIGALLAALLFPILFVPHLGLMNTSIVFGILNVLVGWLMIFLFKDELKDSLILKIKSFLGLIVLVVLLIFNKQVMSFAERNLYPGKIVYQHTTPYQKIVLTNVSKHFQLYLNNNLQFDTKDEYRYHEALVHPVMSMAPQIKQVLILGGGDGLAAREVLKYKEVEQITLVDLDNGMTKMFQTNEQLVKYNQNALNHPKVSVINVDAFIWVKENKSKFDVIIIDFPDPSNFSLGKLYTNYFYQTLQKAMKPQSVASIQTTSPMSAPNAYWCIHETIASVYPSIRPFHVYVPSFGEWGFNLFAANPTQGFKKVYRRVEGLRFYDFNFERLTHFTKDMQAKKQVEVNRLDNQALVRDFEEEWTSFIK